MTNEIDPNSSETERERYSVIIMDPPTMTAQQGARGASRQYDLMTWEELEGLAPAVQALGADNSWLVLWSTNAALPQSLQLMTKLGYRYITNMVWDKRPHMGLGNYLRNSHELVLWGLRGRSPFAFRGQRSVIDFPRGLHSEKPLEFAALLDRVLPSGARLEMFARARPTSRLNYAIWGNQVDSDVSLAEWGYYVPSDFARQGTDGERKV